ncbi:MAG: hypothetical protein IPK19_01350 [Chloroflexi bacterium]|nr:hypothetical protein [Chloroflexota bacterium]
MRSKALIGLTFVIFTLVFAAAVFAEDATIPDAAPTVANCTALSPEDAADYVDRLGGTPGNSGLLAVYICNGIRTTVVGDTESLFGYSCASEIAIYKVENTGKQGLWNVPGKICSGNSLTLQTGGTGHYIIYAAGTVSLPPTISPIVVGGA